jgi:hypothetical protein
MGLIGLDMGLSLTAKIILALLFFVVAGMFLFLYFFPAAIKFIQAMFTP